MAAKASAEVATRAAATHRVTVTFRDFWPDFDPRHFFLPLLRGMAPDIDFVVRPRGPVDLEFVSVFPLPDGFWRPLRRGLARRCPPRWRSLVDAPLAPVAPAADARVSIWFTGENRRPPLGGWDLCLSFDGDSTSLANCHLPLWWLLFPELLLPSVPEATAETFLGRGLTLDEVCSARVAERRWGIDEEMVSTPVAPTDAEGVEQEEVVPVEAPEAEAEAEATETEAAPEAEAEEAPAAEDSGESEAADAEAAAPEAGETEENAASESAEAEEPVEAGDSDGDAKA